jgi:hypothetical protein
MGSPSFSINFPATLAYALGNYLVKAQTRWKAAL